MVADAERRQRPPSSRSRCAASAGPSPSRCASALADDLAALTARAGHHRDRPTGAPPRWRAARRSRASRRPGARAPRAARRHAGASHAAGQARLARAVMRARSVWSSTTLRMRTTSGVTSTHSSSRANSRDSSSVRLRGGMRFSKLSAVDGAHVGELLLLGDVDVHVLVARVLADDHALVDLLRRLDEERAALLQVDHGERRHGAGAVGDERAVDAGLDRAGPRLVALGDRRRDAGAAGVGEEPRAEADEAARGDQELHADPAGAVVRHGLHAALALREQLGDGAEVLLGDVDRHALDGLVHLAVDLLGDDLRLADGQLEALAAHLLDEDRQRELAAALDLPGVGTLGGQDAERDVADELACRGGP